MLNFYEQPSVSYQDGDVYKKIVNAKTSISERNDLFYSKLPDTGLDIFETLLVAGQTEAAEVLISLGYNIARTNKFGENIFYIFSGLWKMTIPDNKVPSIVNYLLSKGVDPNIKSKLGICGRDILFIKYDYVHGEKEVWWNVQDGIRKVYGFEYPMVAQMMYMGKMLVYKTNLEVCNSRVWLDSDSNVLNIRDYIFGFVKIAQYGLILRLLDYLKWYEENQIGGDLSVLLNLHYQKETIVSYALKVRPNELEIVGLLLQYGASPLVETDEGIKEVKLKTTINLLNIQCGLGKQRKWVQYVLESRESNFSPQHSLQD